jgi:hypothetical protein
MSAGARHATRKDLLEMSAIAGIILIAATKRAQLSSKKVIMQVDADGHGFTGSVP